MPRSYRRTGSDAPHKEIVRTLRDVGAFVVDMRAAGGGLPDLLVSRAGRHWFVEVKDGNAVPSARRLRPKQLEFAKRVVTVVVGCRFCALRLLGIPAPLRCCNIDGAKLATDYDAEMRPTP